MTSFALGGPVMVSLRIRLQSQAELPTPGVSPHQLYLITVCVYCRSPVILETDRQMEAVRATAVPSSRGFKQCLPSVISWHKSEQL